MSDYNNESSQRNRSIMEESSMTLTSYRITCFSFCVGFFSFIIMIFSFTHVVAYGTIISRDQLHDIVPTANNMVIIHFKIYQEDRFFTCSYHEKNKENKGTQRKFEWC